MRRVYSYRDLDVWSLSRETAVRLYRLVREFPAHELYGLANQIRRAAASIPANIAEGSARGTRREFVRSLRVARGSLAELESHLLLAADIGYLEPGSRLVMQDLERIRSMLNALIAALQRPGR